MKNNGAVKYQTPLFERTEMNILKRFFIWLTQALIGLVLLGFMVLMIAEWASGCGESYVDAKGKTHVNKCLFIKK